jgi:hypothetical protein
MLHRKYYINQNKILNERLDRVKDYDVKLFPCYSIPLVKWLNNKGLRYKLIGLHPKTKKQFYIFIDDEKLDNLLREWKETKPKT